MNHSTHPICQIVAFAADPTNASPPYREDRPTYVLDAKRSNDCVAPGTSRQLVFPLWTSDTYELTYRQRIYETLGGSREATHFNPSYPPGWETKVRASEHSPKLVIADESSPEVQKNIAITTMEGVQRVQKKEEDGRKQDEADRRKKDEEGQKKCVESLPLPTGKSDGQAHFSGRWKCTVTSNREDMIKRFKVLFVASTGATQEFVEDMGNNTAHGRYERHGAAATDSSPTQREVIVREQKDLIRFHSVRWEYDGCLEYTALCEPSK